MREGISAVLLDFDGPLGDLFAVSPATDVAVRVLNAATPLLAGRSRDLIADTDPLVVVHKASAAGLSEPELHHLENVLRDAEIVAASGATATPGASDLLSWLEAQSISWGVVTNNAPEAVTAFFARLGWPDPLVVGRVSGDPGKMKPHPWSLLRMLEILKADAETACFFGDSVTDIQAARACGVAAIGYANKLGKYDALSAAGASEVFYSIADFQDWLRGGLAETIQT